MASPSLSICHILYIQWNICYCCLVSKSCPTLCNPMDGSLPVSSIYGISQVGILAWVAISFSKGSLWLSSPALVGGFFIIEPPAKHNEILFSHKNEILPFETMWINCEGILLIEKSLIEKDKNCKISHTYGI